VDAAGRFSLVAPRDGDYLVRVSSGDGNEVIGARLSLGGGAHEELELVLARPGSLTGRVHVPAGATTSGLRVGALAPGTNPLGVLPILARTTVDIDPDGRFSIPSLAPGTTRVFLRIPETVRHVGSGWRGSGISWSGEHLRPALELGTVDVPAGG